MNFSDELEQVISHSESEIRVCDSSKKPPLVDFAKEFEKLASFVAEAWKDDHPDAQPGSRTDFNQCVEYVTAEMVKAGTAVGGPAGLEILTGGGSTAACKVCRRVLS